MFTPTYLFGFLAATYTYHKFGKGNNLYKMSHHMSTLSLIYPCGPSLFQRPEFKKKEKNYMTFGTNSPTYVLTTWPSRQGKILAINDTRNLALVAHYTIV